MSEKGIKILQTETDDHIQSSGFQLWIAFKEETI